MLGRMNETEAKWAERVLEWRESGQAAEEFAEGRGFEASTLRFWASRLKKAKAESAERLRLCGWLARFVQHDRRSRRRATRASSLKWGKPASPFVAGSTRQYGGQTVPRACGNRAPECAATTPACLRQRWR
jgi:hypothetical protein